MLNMASRKQISYESEKTSLNCAVSMSSCSCYQYRLQWVPNIITLAWVGIVCSYPPTLSVGIRPNRYSYNLIEDSGEFVVNISSKDILQAVDFCGVVSGKDVDKFSDTGFTPKIAEKVKLPLIRECPVNLECIVKKKIPLDILHLFLGEIINVHITEDILNEKGKINFTKVAPIVYNQDEYWSLHKKIAIYEFSK